MNILEVAAKLEIEIEDSISEIFHGVALPEDFNLDEINQEIDSINDDGRVSEYADSNTPIYYYDIDTDYSIQVSNNGYSIDDVISEGLMKPLKSESDISKAKQVALYMETEREAFSDIEKFKEEINEKYDDFFGEDE